MFQSIFSLTSPYKKRARLLAILWTLLIFIACFIPANEVPEVNVPLADKWVHFLLFAVFSFLWLCARPNDKPGYLFFIFIIGVVLGGTVEVLQGLFTFLGRSRDGMDMLADSIGSLLGVVLFYICYRSANKKS